MRGRETLQQSTFARGEGFHGSLLAVMCLYPPKLSLWLFSQERKNLPFPILLPLVCVGGCASLEGGHWEESCSQCSFAPRSSSQVELFWIGCVLLSQGYAWKEMGLECNVSWKHKTISTNKSTGWLSNLGSAGNIHSSLHVNYLESIQMISWLWHNLPILPSTLATYIYDPHIFVWLW